MTSHALVSSRKSGGSAARVHWYIQRVVERLGVPGVVGIALLAMSGALYLNAIVPMTEERAELVSAVAQARQMTRANNNASSDNGVAGQLQAFHAFFPAYANATKDQRAIYALLRKEGVGLRHAEYKQFSDTELQLVRHEWTLPVSGSYVNVRGFLADLLTELPNVSVDHLSLSRDGRAGSDIKCDIRMTLYYQDGV